MKLKQTASKFTLVALLASGLSVGAIAAGNQGDVADRLDNVSVLELPVMAGTIVKEAPKSVRLAKAAEVVKAAAELAPYSIATVVKSVVKASPSSAADVALVAAQATPDNLRGKNLRYIAASAISAAPGQTQKIVAKLAKAYPAQAEQLLFAATYKRSDKIAGMGILGLRDADPNIFGVKNTKAAEALTPESIEILRSALINILGVDAQTFNTNIVVIGVSLSVVNAIVEAIAESGAVTESNFATLVQSVVNEAAAADSSTNAKDVLQNTLTTLGVDTAEAETLATAAAADGGAVEVAVTNSQQVVELVTVTVNIDPTTERSYSGTTTN